MQKTVSCWSMTELRAKLETMNKKLAKKGLSPMSVISYERKIYQEVEYSRQNDFAGMSQIIGEVTAELPYFEVIVEMPEEKFVHAGYSFLGTIDGGETGNIINPVKPEFGKKLEVYRQGKLHCDHCKTNHRRKITIVFEKLETGQVMMLGSNCAKEYFGIDLANYLSNLIMVMEDRSFGGDFEAGARASFEAHLFMAAVLYNIRKKGFCSKGMAERNGSYSTDYESDQLLRILSGREENYKNDKWNRSRQDFINELPKLMEEASGITKFFESLETEDTFLLNCKIAISDNNYSRRGLLAAAVHTYYKQVLNVITDVQIEDAEKIAEQIEMQRRLSLTRWFGQPGEKIEVEAQLVEILNIQSDSMWSDSVQLVKWVTLDLSSEIVWWTNSNIYALKPGRIYKIKGTVKSHGDYKGIRSTSISRAKYEELTNAMV